MNNDTSFIELTYPENLDKIDIDPRLKDVFIRVMYRLQNYFNKHNYTKNFNYYEFFQKYLLNSGVICKMRFKVSEKDYIGNKKFSACYQNNKWRIMVSKKILNHPQLEKIFCHEFIHFLSNYRLFVEEDINEKNKEVYNGGFINEALTEMLTLEIYPEFKPSTTYLPQVKMMEFVNKLCGSINFYQCFLLGYIDINVVKGFEKSNTIRYYEDNFYNSISRYQKSFADYDMVNALNSKDYLDGQRYIVLAVLETINTFDSYFNFLKVLAEAPVSDYSFLNEYLENKEKMLIGNLGIQNESYGLLLNDLRRLRNDILIYNRKSFILQFSGGTIYYYNNRDFVVYINGKVSRGREILKSINQSFNNGVYTFNYVINNVHYYCTFDKNTQYFNLQNSYNSFFKGVDYALKGFSIVQESENIYPEFPLKNSQRRNRK